MATRDLERLGATVKAHRLQRYKSRDDAAIAADITKDTWQRIEEGRPARELSYAKMERALDWAPGSWLLVAEGGSPVLADVSSPGSRVPAGSSAAPALSADTVRRAAYEAAMAKMPNAPIGEVQAFVDELVEALRRTGEVSDGD